MAVNLLMLVMLEYRGYGGDMATKPISTAKVFLVTSKEPTEATLTKEENVITWNILSAAGQTTVIVPAGATLELSSSTALLSPLPFKAALGVGNGNTGGEIMPIDSLFEPNSDNAPSGRAIAELLLQQQEAAHCGATFTAYNDFAELQELIPHAVVGDTALYNFGSVNTSTYSQWCTTITRDDIAPGLHWDKADLRLTIKDGGRHLKKIFFTADATPGGGNQLCTDTPEAVVYVTFTNTSICGNFSPHVIKDGKPPYVIAKKVFFTLTHLSAERDVMLPYSNTSGTIAATVPTYFSAPKISKLSQLLCPHNGAVVKTNNVCPLYANLPSIKNSIQFASSLAMQADTIVYFLNHLGKGYPADRLTKGASFTIGVDTRYGEPGDNGPLWHDGIDLPTEVEGAAEIKAAFNAAIARGWQGTVTFNQRIGA